MNCPLCLSTQSELFDQDKHRHYFKCPECSLVFVSRSELISESQEKNRYEAHENSEDDQDYILYLSQVANSLRPHLVSNMRGLDFGCGKSHLLEKILSPIQVSSYDLYFHPREELLKNKYHFIIMSEVIEHLRFPRETLFKLSDLLLPEGILFIKTKLRPENAKEFSQWFYKRDSTHIQFFNEHSFEKLKEMLKCESYKKIGEDLFSFKL